MSPIALRRLVGWRNRARPPPAKALAHHVAGSRSQVRTYIIAAMSARSSVLGLDVLGLLDHAQDAAALPERRADRCH